jgi:hypothetical protein
MRNPFVSSLFVQVLDYPIDFIVKHLVVLEQLRQSLVVKSRISHRVFDPAMTEVYLDGSDIDPAIH